MINFLSILSALGKTSPLSILLGFIGVAIILFFSMTSLRSKKKKTKPDKISAEEKKLKDFWEGYERPKK